MTGECPFCERVARGEYDRKWPGVVAFEPRHPVVPGHLLVVPEAHVRDVAEDPVVSAAVMAAAAELAGEVGDCNVITSKGPAATQTVHHLHLHLVPRHAGDGLTLPWTGQQKERTTP